MRILIVRFSAMGDVAICYPLLKALTETHPEHEFHFVTKKNFLPIFQDLENIHVHGLDLKKEYSGIGGILKLARFTNRLKPEVFIDLHDVLRTQALSFFYKVQFKPVFIIDKGRKEKKDLIRNNSFFKLKTTLLRYLEVTQKANLLLDLPLEELEKKVNQSIKKPSHRDTIHIGIAPFAAHQPKIWPIQNWMTVLEAFKGQNIQFHFFGGGESEKNQVQGLVSKYPNALNTIGQYSFSEELQKMTQLDLMISMDSGNMHLAYLQGIPVWSIWGATHSHAGFALPETEKYHRFEISKEDLPCRPCSIYGNKPCFRGDNACMNMIEPTLVIEKIRSAFNC
ncbi:MAG: glycosyltransferase family 9 protein [Leadbetterella sp.]